MAVVEKDLRTDTPSVTRRARVPEVPYDTSTSPRGLSRRDKELLALVRHMSEDSSGASFEEQGAYLGLTLVLLATIANIGAFIQVLKGGDGPLLHGPWLCAGLVGFLFSLLFPTGRTFTMYWVRELTGSGQARATRMGDR